MSQDVADRARARFELLRQKALENGPPGGPFEPADGWCISAISRLVVACQDIVPAIVEVQQALVDPAVWPYPAESLHLSLLGCTPREEIRQPADDARAIRISQAVAQTVGELRPIDVSLGRVNVIGTQLFVEVATPDRRWADARVALERAVRALGEEPLSYPDPEPMHLNIARFVAEPTHDFLERALAVPSIPGGDVLQLTAIETVVTDFVVTPGTLRVVRTDRL